MARALRIEVRTGRNEFIQRDGGKAKMNRLLSFDHPTTPGLNPLQVIALAHSLECDAVVLRMHNDPRYPGNPYNLSGDAALRRRIREEVAARGLFVAAGCAVEVRPGMRVAELQPVLEAAAEIGARALSVVVYDMDKLTHVPTVGELAERAGKLNVRPLLEFFALSGVNSLPYAADLVKVTGNPALGISLDSLHVTRTGATNEQIAAVPPGYIVHAQLNDGPAQLPLNEQLEEAWGNRLLPGEGEFDLSGMLLALPPDVPIGVEAGNVKRFAEGVTMEEHGRDAVEAMRRVIAKALGN
jgi:sugar phosphate isomerase/epimerase